LSSAWGGGRGRIRVVALFVEICNSQRRLPDDAAWHDQFVPHLGEEEDESERAVARLVPGKGIDPPSGGA
jgi:hypothetical protein